MTRAEQAAELARTIATLAGMTGLDWNSRLAALAAVAGATMAEGYAEDPRKAHLMAQVHAMETLRHFYLNAPQAGPPRMTIPVWVNPN